MAIKKINNKTTSNKEIEEKKIPDISLQKNENIQDEISREIIEDPNSSPIFDVFLYRELFMSVKQKIDTLFDKREKSDKDSDAYDDAVYNITTNAINECGAQDFLSYCYKRGKYDFCLMNYEKYMKWSLLAAANGNAFTLSKLQIFLANAVDNVLNLENHSYMLDFLELTPEHYYTFLTKLVCEEMVKILNISAEALIKMPEVYQEENEELLRLFDNAKLDAAEIVKTTLKNAIDQLVEFVKRAAEEEKALKEKSKIENKIEEETIEQEIAVQNQGIKEEKSQVFKKPKIKKFRW